MVVNDLRTFRFYRLIKQSLEDYRGLGDPRQRVAYRTL